MNGNRLNNEEKNKKYSSVTVVSNGQEQNVQKKKTKIKNVYRTHTLRSRRKRSVPIGIVLTLIVITLMLMMLVSNYVALNEYTREVAALNSSLETLKSEEKKLNSDIDNSTDVLGIEKYASESLGMVGSADVEKRYVEVSEGEKIEVYEVEDDGTMGAITSALFALTDNLIESWNILMGN